MNRLENKVALVTGAGSGIGRSIALTFAREGADIIVNDIKNDGSAEAVAGAIRRAGRKAVTIRADVSNRNEVNEMVSGALAEFGRIDILVNNAGVCQYQPFLELEQDVWDRTVGVDQTGVFNCSQQVARHMASQGGGGKIINIASMSGEESSPSQSHYAAAKAAVIRLTEGMAYELGPYGINVNAIGPGWVSTPITEDYLADPQLRERVEATIPVRRVAKPEDIANVALFLACNESDYLSGTYIRADGGLIAGRGKV